MNISRRFFIASAASFGAFAGCRFLNAAPTTLSGNPRLKFGVVSDVHISNLDRPAIKGQKAPGQTNAIFRKTLEYFRAQNVDAVVIAGDFTNRGCVDEFLAVAAAWYDVFPNDRYPDGLFALDELPQGEVTFKVTPENCFDRAGTPIVAKLA